MRKRVHFVLITGAMLVVAALLLSPAGVAQSNQDAEEFTATAIVNNDLGSGVDRVQVRITRWSSDAERTRLVETLLKKGPSKMLDELADSRSVGFIKTPDSLGYDLRYAHQTPGEDGGRRIVIATDRPIGFWEQTNRPRTIEYPFTVIQMQIGRDGKGTGTMSYATKIRAYGSTIELEDFATSPVMLTSIEARRLRN